MLSTAEQIIIGIGLGVTIAAYLTMAILYLKERDKVSQYKTAIWLAVGNSQNGESYDKIYGIVECYMPECDKAHFRRNFSEK